VTVDPVEEDEEKEIEAEPLEIAFPLVSVTELVLVEFVDVLVEFVDVLSSSDSDVSLQLKKKKERARIAHKIFVFFIKNPPKRKTLSSL